MSRNVEASRTGPTVEGVLAYFHVNFSRDNVRLIILEVAQEANYIGLEEPLPSTSNNDTGY